MLNNSNNAELKISDNAVKQEEDSIVEKENSTMVEQENEAIVEKENDSIVEYENDGIVEKENNSIVEKENDNIVELENVNANEEIDDVILEKEDTIEAIIKTDSIIEKVENNDEYILGLTLELERVKKLRNKNIDLEDKIGELNNKIDELNNKIIELNDNNKLKVKELAELTELNDKEVANLKSQIKKFDIEIEENKKRVNKLESIKINLSSEVKELNDKIMNLNIVGESNLSKFEIEKTRINREKDELTEEIEKLKKRMKYSGGQLIVRSTIIDKIYNKIIIIFESIMDEAISIKDEDKKNMNLIIKNIISLRRFYVGVDSSLDHERLYKDTIELIKKIEEKFREIDLLEDINSVLEEFKRIKFEGEDF